MPGDDLVPPGLNSSAVLATLFDLERKVFYCSCRETVQQNIAGRVAESATPRPLREEVAVRSTGTY
jgi:hypothetical protein